MVSEFSQAIIRWFRWLEWSRKGKLLQTKESILQNDRSRKA
jgi:hypothetical protein